MKNVHVKMIRYCVIARAEEGELQLNGDTDRLLQPLAITNFSPIM